MAIFYKQINPTTNENISAGYAINDVWLNTITYSRYTMLSDGVWSWTEGSGTFLNPNEFGTSLNIPTILIN